MASFRGLEPACDAVIALLLLAGPVEVGRGNEGRGEKVMRRTMGALLGVVDGM